MMFLRLLSLMTGALVLVAPAILIRAGGMPPDAGKAAASLVCVVLASTGFLLIGMAGPRLRRSAWLRTLAALLLAIPAGASAALLWRGAAPAMLWQAGAMLGFTALLYLTMVYRVLRIRRPGPLRRRAQQLAPLAQA